METICAFHRSAAASLAVDLIRQRQHLVARLRTIEPPPHLRGHTVFVLESTEGVDSEQVIDSLLESARAEPILLEQAVTCPECGSLHLQYPEHPKRSPSMRSVGYLIDRVSRWLNLAPPAFRCRRCDNVWTHARPPRPGERPRRKPVPPPTPLTVSMRKVQPTR